MILTRTSQDIYKILKIHFGSGWSGLGYLKGKNLPGIKEDLEEIERMLKALIKSLENKHLNPWILESLTPFDQLVGRRIKNIQSFRKLGWNRYPIELNIYFRKRAGNDSEKKFWRFCPKPQPALKSSRIGVPANSWK